jgi:hypothetical protein
MVGRGPGRAVPRGAAVLELGQDGKITKLTAGWDGFLLDDAAITAAAAHAVDMLASERSCKWLGRDSAVCRPPREHLARGWRSCARVRRLLAHANRRTQRRTMCQASSSSPALLAGLRIPNFVLWPLVAGWWLGSSPARGGHLPHGAPRSGSDR